MKPSYPENRTHDDKRNGTTCLMMALGVVTGKVTGQMVKCHRSEEFLAFLYLVSEGIKPGTQVHVVLDSVSYRKSTEVNEWLKNNANWMFHFTPTSSSCMNAVKGSFPGFRGRGSNTRSSTRLTSASRRLRATSSTHNTNDARPFFC